MRATAGALSAAEGALDQRRELIVWVRRGGRGGVWPSRRARVYPSLAILKKMNHLNVLSTHFKRARVAYVDYPSSAFGYVGCGPVPATLEGSSTVEALYARSPPFHFLLKLSTSSRADFLQLRGLRERIEKSLRL